MREDDDDATVTVLFQTTSDSAVCVREHEDGPDIWLPLSQVEFEKTRGSGAPERDDVIRLSAPEWLLNDRGML